MRLILPIFLFSVPCLYGQVTVHLNGTQIGTRPVLNFSAGTGMSQSCVDRVALNRVDCSSSINSAIVTTHDTIHSNENYCDSANGSTQYSCKLPFKALPRYVLGMTFLLRADATCSASCSLDIDTNGSRNIKMPDGTTDPRGAIIAGQPYWIFFDGTVFRLLSASGISAAASSPSSADERGDVRARRVIGAMDTMTYAPTMSVDVTAGDLHKITTANSAGNATMNARTAGIPGQHMWILIANDQISPKTITFGANLRSAGPITGTPGKTSTLQFVSDGSAWYEVARTQGL